MIKAGVLLLLCRLTLTDAWEDCDPAKLLADGPFGPPTFVNETWNGTNLIYTLIPRTKPSNGAKFPLVAFMHGSTGQWEMYRDNLVRVASHGFAVVFPFIKNPAADARPLTLETNGKHLLEAIDYAAAMSSQPGSALYGTVDATKVIVAGHSMGATDAIAAGLKLAKAGAGIAKAVYAMHPGICGPIGPPPWPSTWMKGDLRKLTAALPVTLTTATNDAAFWPAPHTAEHELGCFRGGVADDAKAAVFAEFTEVACAEDGLRKPDGFEDGGHNCPLKFSAGGAPEFPWLLTAAKLWAQQDGAAGRCRDLLLGSSADSLQNVSSAINVVVQQAA